MKQALAPTFKLGKFELRRDVPHVMGVLNLTEDSFYEGSRVDSMSKLLFQAENMIEAGASILDLGAESSRPGASPVSLDDELKRLVPALEALKARFDFPLSVDTYKPEVMREASLLGVSLINDIYALRQPGALETMVNSDAAICLMHMQKEPQTMQAAPSYNLSVTEEVGDFLEKRVAACLGVGISHSRIIIDPGFGFGKTTAHNLQLLKSLSSLNKLDCPILVGLSRKSMLGELLDKPVQDRLSGSIALATLASQQGAWIVRAHDVAETYDALKVVHAMLMEDV